MDKRAEVYYFPVSTIPQLLYPQPMGMPVRSADIVPYWSLLRAADDTSPVGGAIDTSMRVYFNDLIPSPTDTIEVVSTVSQDITQSITITVMTTLGLILTETLQLHGLLPIDFSSLGSINRIESAVLDSACSGTVIVRQASNLQPFSTIPPGEIGFRRMFYQSAPSGTAIKIYYEKFFWKNTNTQTAVTSATVVLPANPSGEIAHCVAAALNDSGQIANRITAPANSILAAPFQFNTATQNVPTSSVPATSAIGVWAQMTLQPAPLPLRSSFTSQLSGATPF